MCFFRLSLLVAIPTLVAVPVSAQAPSPWQPQSSGTTASLRGIDSVNSQVAWASGTGGTVLRTTDGGAHWLPCTTPDVAKDAANLDFRGVQALNAQTAFVMSSGPGEQSRIYKTTDGCTTWSLVFANPDAPNGFFDSFWFNGPRGIIVGDPVHERFVVFLTGNGGKSWKRDDHPGLSVHGKSLGAYAASNSSVAIGSRLFTRGFVAGGKSGSLFFNRPFTQEEEQNGLVDKLVRKTPPWKSSPIPITAGTDSSGPFSVAFRYPVTTGDCPNCGFDENSLFVAVGGDYSKPNDATSVAAWSSDGGWTWTASKIQPHGFRSAVQFSSSLKVWITAGTNGSDISRDNGETWHFLDDGNWSALSLPFIVGANGRIARLNLAALPKP